MFFPLLPSHNQIVHAASSNRRGDPSLRAQLTTTPPSPPSSSLSALRKRAPARRRIRWIDGCTDAQMRTASRPMREN